MKKILHRCMAVALSLFLVFQVFPTGVLAEESDFTDTTLSDTSREEEEIFDSETEWEETGMLNSDGTPVTADQGDMPEPLGDVQSLSNEPSVQPASYTLTLDLDGGQVNTMDNFGWSQSSYETYKWMRTVTETEAGQGVLLTLDSTLGGLIPGQPYRAGYIFTGWKIGDTEYGANDNRSVTITEDATVDAQWQIATYNVSFQGNDGELWSVEVPYGAALWTDDYAPWTEDTVSWADDNTAAVSVTFNGAAENITVTRHPDELNNQQYYYTFILEGVYYFTYGGSTPTKNGQYFTGWKLMYGGSGFTVTDDAAFSAQFQMKKSYVFNVYFYYENGTKAEDPVAVTKTEDDVYNGEVEFNVQIPSITYYTAVSSQTDGVTWDGGNVTVDIDAVFGEENTSATNFLALTVIYKPAQITYTVNYYQQPVNENEPYKLVGSTTAQSIEYGSKISVEDMPDFGQTVSFEGFQVNVDSQYAVSDGVVLREETPDVKFDKDGNATVNIYYDRASYFIYFQTGTTEVQIDPVKNRYGSEMPDLKDEFDSLTREGYEKITEQDISWYRLDELGNLAEIDKDDLNGKIPAYDLYAVVTWTPATTSIRLVYWVESRNAASFQNAYITTVDGISTESELTVTLDGNMTISGDGWTSEIDGSTVVSEGFTELISNHYGTNGDYTQFFSYSPENTKTSPGNVTNAQETGSGEVTDGAITGNSYNVKVKGDGTTTINIYYTRNLYTLEFVLARQNNHNQNFSLATNTPGSFSTSKWNGSETNINQFVFEDFTDGVTATEVSGENYGGLNVEKIYQITNAMELDPRSAVGRYGKKVIVDNSQVEYTCFVYTLTARFEADISALWPTVENLSETYNNTYKYKYISMGTDENSYYHNVFTSGNDQKNILNVYSTMDMKVVTSGATETDWTATADSGDGTVTHEMVAYWNKGAFEYHYYLLLETLDTTVSVDDEEVTPFDSDTANDSGYSDGQYVSWNGNVYVYTDDYNMQYSTSDRFGQNQPARQGFISEGKSYSGADDAEGGNIYFFYTREIYTLDIQNLDRRYIIPPSLLNAEFDCLSQYVEGARTLRELGWESIHSDGTVFIRFKGYLEPLNEKEIVTWITEKADNKLEYPYGSPGENQYYFWRWYRNQMQTIPVEWETDNDIRTITSNQTLYAGWFTPRYTTSYVLNGGTWTDSIEYTLTTIQTKDSQQVYIYYPHQADSADAPLYWYVQSKDNDRLFVDVLYVCRVGDVANKDETGAHWVINEDLTVDEMMEYSSEDYQGSRLVDRYFCYMGEGGLYNHDYYININSTVNTVLEEPSVPVRTGYTFRGWFYFDDEPAYGTKIYLKDVLTGNQSLASYGEGYVYLNHVGDAFILHEDENGQLFYYPEQTGYRFSYSNAASVVVNDLNLCAAWISNGDANAYVYHLVKKEVFDLENQTSLTPKGESPITIDGDTATITVGGVEYYIMYTEDLPSLYNGSTYIQTAWEYCMDESDKKWLPAQATIDINVDTRTQTVTEDTLDSVTGNTYRIENNDGTYTYYAYFVYEVKDEIVYNIYAIDLSAAVADDVLNSYQDTFDRSFQVDTSAGYLLRMEQKSVDVNNINTTLVVENAPMVNGYTVYHDWSQELQLHRDESSNNIFFYYVRDTANIRYSITYYLMVDGSYSPNNAVAITDIPAVTGEIISLNDMTSSYDRLLNMVETYSGYSDSTNEAHQSLYNRYKDMTVTLTKNGVNTSYTVNTDDVDTLNLSDITELYLDYYVDGWSPTGDSLVMSNDTEIEVYLATAQLIIQKVDTSYVPLKGAEFKLERLIEDENGTILYNGKSYVPDETFEEVTAISGEDGKAVFYNLSAKVFEDGKGYLYRLTETQAPKGYNCLEEPMYVTTPYTVEGETYYTVTYTVVNSGIPHLPGSCLFGGVYSTMFLGIGLMAAAVCVGILFYRRKKSDS